MENFDYLAKTKIFFGKNRENEVGEIIRSYGFKKVLIHYGQGSVKKNGLYDRVITSLKENDIDYIELGGVLPNPDIELVRKGIKVCQENNVDFILSIGGGSTADSAKLIAHGVYYNGDSYDISLKKYISHKALPIGVIITFAASGSEMSASCVISNRQNHMKKGFLSELNRPLFAIENPELTYSLSTYQTGCGIVDIISHTFERYFNKSDDIEFSDYLAEGLLKSVIDAGEILLKDPKNYNARATIMLASSYSHNGLTNLGKKGLMPIHQLEHELSALNDHIPHGAGLAILIPSWMEVVKNMDKEKFVKFARRVCLIQNPDDDQAIENSIQYLSTFFNKFGMPNKLKDFGITKNDMIVMANRLTDNGNKTFPSNIPLTKELALQIYSNCL